MRWALAIAAAAVAASASAAGFVRVKTRLPTATIAGESAAYSLAEAGTSVKIGGVGPEKAVLRLRRVAPTKSTGAIAVTVDMDGRRIAKLTVGGTLLQKLENSTALAGPAVEHVVDMAPGPHVIAVTLGAGKGQVAIAVRLASEPAVASAKAPAPTTEKAVAAEKPSAPLASRLEEEEAPVEKRPGKLSEEEEEPVASREAPKAPSAPVPTTKAPAPQRTPPSAAPAPAATVRTEAPAPALQPRGPERIAASARVGVAEHLQLGVVGPSIGATLDYTALPFLVLRLSGDYLSVGARYTADLGGPGAAAGTVETRIWSLSLLANVLARGTLAGGAVRPFGGLGFGIAVGSQATGVAGLSSAQSSAGAAVAFAVIAGADYQLGPGRLGGEARLLLTSESGFGSAARSLDMGGLLFEATYRYAF